MGLTYTDKLFGELKLIAQDLTPVGQARIAAAIVHKREVIAYGVNRRKTHPLQKKYARNEHAVCLHAEIDAIVNTLMRYKDGEILKKSTLYVVRAKKKHGKFVFGLAKPCEGCQEAVKDFGFKKVYWSKEDV